MLPLKCAFGLSSISYRFAHYNCAFYMAIWYWI